MVTSASSSTTGGGGGGSGGVSGSGGGNMGGGAAISTATGGGGSGAISSATRKLAALGVTIMGPNPFPFVSVSPPPPPPPSLLDSSFYSKRNSLTAVPHCKHLIRFRFPGFVSSSLHCSSSRHPFLPVLFLRFLFRILFALPLVSFASSIISSHCFCFLFPFSFSPLVDAASSDSLSNRGNQLVPQPPPSRPIPHFVSASSRAAASASHVPTSGLRSGDTPSAPPAPPFVPPLRFSPAVPSSS